MAAEQTDRWLIFGKGGWIGGLIGELLAKQGAAYKFADSRLENREQVARELDEYKPTRVINAAGITGRPNVDWCEDHRQETIRANVVGTLQLADLTQTRGMHLTVYATGCIYSYDAAHPIGGPAFTEEDEPNFAGSFYSKTKGMVEPLLREFDNTLVLRVRMPIEDALGPRNFITKITKYERVVDIPNSMTVLTEMLPISVSMAKKKLVGIYNFCNPGAISHNQILALYKEYIDPSFTWKNFTEEEQSKVIKAGRSNNTLDHTKFVAANPEFQIDDIHTAMVKVFQRMQVNLGIQKQ